MNPDPKYQDKRRFAKVRFKGGSFITTPQEAADFIDDADEPSNYIVSDVWLTPYEYDNMPEFSGF